MDARTNFSQTRPIELSERVNKQSDEFGKRGEFVDDHRALLIQIERRRRELRARVRRAEESGSTWELIKAEFVRDFSSLGDTFLQFLERLDSDAMKRQRYH